MCAEQATTAGSATPVCSSGSKKRSGNYQRSEEIDTVGDLPWKVLLLLCSFSAPSSSVTMLSSLTNLFAAALRSRLDAHQLQATSKSNAAGR